MADSFIQQRGSDMKLNTSRLAIIIMALGACVPHTAITPAEMEAAQSASRQRVRLS